MTPTTTPAAAGRMTADLARQIHALSRDEKEQLVTWLQEDLDGGPTVGDLPEPPADDPEKVKAAWKDELAGRIRDIQEGKVVLVDAREAAAAMLRRMEEKYGA